MTESMKILLVEDRQDDIDTYEISLKIYEETTGNKISLIICKTIEEALSAIDNTLDAAIIDLRLNGNNDGGSEVLNHIFDRLKRLPIVIHSATPQDLPEDIPLVKKHVKGEIEFRDIVEELYVFFKTGITRIFGGRGLLENTMDQVFNKSVAPQSETWKEYAEKGTNIEKSLIRLTIGHLYHLLDDGTEGCIPEEMYILPNDQNKLYTGSILQKDDLFFIVTSPPCDMVIHGEKGRKTSKIALCEIENHDEIINDHLGETKKFNKRINNIVNTIKNNNNNYQHWLPKALEFKGGFINFRHILTLTEVEITDQYELQQFTVSPNFMKDIISRFSAYYARQGQPDFSFEEIATIIESKI